MTAHDEGISLGAGKATRETAKALLVRLESEDSERWVPKSVLHDDSEVYEIGHEGEVVVKEWWARREGLGE